MKGLKAGTKYTFRVAGINKGGTGSQSSSCAAVTLPDAAKIKSIKRASLSTAVVKFTPAKGTGTVVYLKTGSGSYKKVGTTTKSSYTIKGLKKGKSYQIKLRSYVKNGTKTFYGSDSKVLKYKAK